MTTHLSQPRLRREKLDDDDRAFASRMIGVPRSNWSAWATGRASAIICTGAADVDDARLVEQLRYARDAVQ